MWQSQAPLPSPAQAVGFDEEIGRDGVALP